MATTLQPPEVQEHLRTIEVHDLLRLPRIRATIRPSHIDNHAIPIVHPPSQQFLNGETLRRYVGRVGLRVASTVDLPMRSMDEETTSRRPTANEPPILIYCSKPSAYCVLMSDKRVLRKGCRCRCSGSGSMLAVLTVRLGWCR
ncbi:hypothetical protein FOCG_13125 [Fusarium oxysporum f. sp. radicis-lycopersici 26381]|uniref:Uncharacterized protein n=1 Tax=Fusarium oxysporum Fo47 TaxID=660027 RepID=W9JPH8_FUSOX|nr:hypothetical protein FOZG_13968 [Fusarium oxysporum Fo47]EWZ86193.1 hypothetical protein FOWG_11246 [Fusarium oxysporum f. sp. lycopersici MN25]EXL45762.1 hypothetical protein FOCG_13125 [Fusarium oxysporum f. sp. radicis-lycopersici 26381]